jgi:hypothetical protein
MSGRTGHIFLIPALGGAEWPASGCDHFNPRKDSVVTTGLEADGPHSRSGRGCEEKNLYRESILRSQVS